MVEMNPLFEKTVTTWNVGNNLLTFEKVETTGMVTLYIITRDDRRQMTFEDVVYLRDQLNQFIGVLECQ